MRARRDRAKAHLAVRNGPWKERANLTEESAGTSKRDVYTLQRDSTSIPPLNEAITGDAMDVDVDSGTFQNYKHGQGATNIFISHQETPDQRHSMLPPAADPLGPRLASSALNFGHDRSTRASRLPGRQTRNREMPPPPTPPMAAERAPSRPLMQHGSQMPTNPPQTTIQYSTPDSGSINRLSRKRPPSPPSDVSSPAKMLILSATSPSPIINGKMPRNSQLPPSSQYGPNISANKSRLPALGMRRTTVLAGTSSQSHAKTGGLSSTPATRVTDRKAALQQRPRPFTPPFSKTAATAAPLTMSASQRLLPKGPTILQEIGTSFGAEGDLERKSTISALPTPEMTPTQSQFSVSCLHPPPVFKARNAGPDQHSRQTMLSQPPTPAPQQDSSLAQAQSDAQECDVVITEKSCQDSDDTKAQQRSSSPFGNEDADTSFNSSDYDIGIDADELEKACSMYD